MNRFVNQAAVISGGGSGIGLAVAEKLASEGAKIWILYYSPEACLKASQSLRVKGYDAEYITTDISNEEEVKTAFAKIQSLSSCDIAVNSAGVVGPNGIKTEQVDLVDFEKTCRINLIGSFLFT